MSDKYRPSNGTEGECFIGHWCCNCERDADSENNPCQILGRTYHFDIDDPEYPTEWIRDETGPKCTAFIPLGDPLPTPRCEKTIDMFQN